MRQADEAELMKVGAEEVEDVVSEPVEADPEETEEDETKHLVAEAEEAVGAVVEHEEAELEETKVDEAEPVEAEVEEAVVVMAEPEEAALGEITLTTTYWKTRLFGIDLSSVDLDKVKKYPSLYCRQGTKESWPIQTTGRARKHRKKKFRSVILKKERRPKSVSSKWNQATSSRGQRQ